MRRLIICFLSFGILSSCASVLKYEQPELLEKNDEFAQAVKIEDAAEVAARKQQETPPPAPSGKKPGKIKTKKTVAKKPRPAVVTSTIKPSAPKSKAPAKAVEIKPVERQPDIEDSAGFAQGSRRPLVDPFKVGEEVVHSVSYFGVNAGEVKLKVEPFKHVNGRKSYSFVTELRTSSVFSKFYSVEDRAETLVDFADLFPTVFTLHVKESGQLREARSIFDPQSLQATYWEKKVTKKSGVEEKKQQWEILPYSQNVFSAIFYMRVFKWEEGKEYSFRVADDEKNLVFKGKAIRKEKLDTEIGEKNAIVVKPEITVKGAFQPIGDIFIWLSDDEHKHVLRIESKIKIGTLVSEIVRLNPGQ